MADVLNWFVTLRCGPTVRNCWVDKKVKLGDTVTLKDSEDPSRSWLVEYVSAQARSKGDMGRGWHVGGL